MFNSFFTKCSIAKKRLRTGFAGKNKKGFALTLVAVMVVILFAMGLGMLRLGMNARVRAARTTADIAARTAADAGLTKALFEMNKKLNITPWNNSNLPNASNTGLLSSDQRYSFSVDANDYTITSTGTSGTASRTVTSTLNLTNGLFDCAVFGNSSVTLAKDSLVDTINSNISLLAADSSSAVQIGTNSTGSADISLGQDVIVDGDVLVGVGGDPLTVISENTGVSVTGTKEALEETVLFETVTAPSYPIWPDISVAASGSAAINNNGEYSAIDLGMSSVLTITGDVSLYVTGDITLQKDGQITISSGSSLTVYLNGDLTAAKNSGFNNTTQVPGNFKLYTTGTGTQQIALKKDSDFFGAIYAPNANISIDKEGNIYGSIVCNTFTQSKAGNIYYDEALKDGDINDIGVEFTIGRWQE